jgi:transcriptional regulator with PAS, ATPase and Fis domain
MSSGHFSLTKVAGRWRIQDLGSRNGTFINRKPVQSAVLKDGDVIEAGRTFFVYRHQIRYDTFVPTEPTEFPAFATLDPELNGHFNDLERIAKSAISVLVLGETGTGKELVARALHTLSGRPGAFIGINCGALPEALVESQLFGHKRGAFSGADRENPGLVVSADKGTLFFDEIGDLPLAAQAKLLRVLQEKQVLPLGATRPIDVDLRICTATHRDIHEMVEKGTFREDLFSRISGFTLKLPSLRERRQDFGLLINNIFQRVGRTPGDGLKFTPSAVRELLQYEWPRNIRELEKALETALVLANDKPIDLEHLPPTLRKATGRAAGQTHETPEARQQRLVLLLRQHNGSISAVARALGKDRVQIRRWLRQCDVNPMLYRSR